MAGGFFLEGDGMQAAIFAHAVQVGEEIERPGFRAWERHARGAPRHGTLGARFLRPPGPRARILPPAFHRLRGKILRPFPGHPRAFTARAHRPGRAIPVSYTHLTLP